MPEEPRDGERDRLLVLMDELARLDRDLPAGVSALEAASYLRKFIEDKRSAPGDDLVSALLEPTEGEPALSDEELLSTIFLVMSAGYETTAGMLTNSVHALLLDTAQQGSLRADPALIPGAVEEFPRFESPLNLATVRYALEDVQLDDVSIAQGDIVLVSLAAANRDAGRFDRPGELDLVRPDNSHLAFGHGIHHCLGAPLARLEGEIALRKLLDRFADWRPAGPPEELRWRNSTQFRTLARLPVTLR